MRRPALGACIAFACLAGCRDDPGEVVEAPPSTPPPAVVEALAKIVATCADARGAVEGRRKGQPQWDRVVVGATFRERDWVRTGSGGFARIRFSAGGFVELREATTILIDTALSIESGSLVAVAEPDGPILVRAKDGSEAKIVSTTAGSARLRLTASGSDGLEIAVTEGNVDVIADDVRQSIAKGELRELAKHRTGEAVKLIGFPRSVAPGIDARFRYVPDMKVALTWKPVPEASRYHVQIARDTEFEELVLDEDARSPAAAFSPGGVGDFAWRVAAIDNQGRMGEFGFVRRLYVEEEEPRDLLVSPPDGIKFGFVEKYPRITFSWQSAGNTQSYKLVVLSNDVPVATTKTPGQRVEIATLREGVYRWGVYALRDKREVPIFITWRTLIVRKQRVKAHTEKLWDAR